MCLSTTDFSLEWDNGGHAFVGYGYKRVKERDLIKYKTWQEAKCDKFTESPSKNYTTKSNDGKSYIPGFHIFLSRSAARSYTSNAKLVKVKFKEVLGFGTNMAGSSNRPCIIARYMKIVEIL